MATLSIRIFLLSCLAFPVFADNLADIMAAARAAKSRQDVTAAQNAYDRAFALALAGPAQRIGSIAGEVALFYSQQKNPGQAEAILKRAIEVLDSAHAKPIDKIPALVALAGLYNRERQPGDLAVVQERLVQTWGNSVGTDSAVVANMLVHLAQTQQQNKDFSPAEASIERAITILEKTYGPDASSTGYAVSLLAKIEQQLGNTEAATAASDRAAAIRGQQDPGAVSKPGEPKMSPPRVVSKEDPRYSEAARKARVQGSILLSLTVDETGTPQNVTLLIPLGDGLDEAAIQTVKKWRFQPGTKGGVAVPVRAQIEVNFALL